MVAAAMLTLGVAVAEAGAATRVGGYSPFNAEGALRAGLRVTPAFGGACTTGSFVLSDDLAYRCFIGSVIRDPCFLDEVQGNSERSVVVCAESPWARDVVRLRVTGALKSSYGARPGGAPWAVRLASGRRCVAVTGATALVRGRRLSYTCQGGRWLLGSPNRDTSRWNIQQVSGPTDRRPRRVVIARAWQ